MRQLPRPSEIDDVYFLRELAWCVYNAGMKNTVIEQKWPLLLAAYHDFKPKEIINDEGNVIRLALAVIKHRGKVNAITSAAYRVVEDSPIGLKLGRMTEQEALDYLRSYSYIGNITKYHLARNIGFDVVKPDRHLVRIANFMGFSSPDELVDGISALTGERKGFIDYVIWQWLSLQGKEAYEIADGFKRAN